MKRLLSRFERPQEHRTVLGRELGVDVQTAILVVPEPADESVALRLVSIGGADPARRPHHPLELGRRRVPGELEQVGLALVVGRTCQHAHLRVAELAAREARANQRQLAQAARNSDVLACGPWRYRAAPGNPLRRRATAASSPALAAVELTDELDPARGVGGDARGE